MDKGEIIHNLRGTLQYIGLVAYNMAREQGTATSQTREAAIRRNITKAEQLLDQLEKGSG